MVYRYKIGAMVVYRPGFGMDPPTVATILGIGEKNNRQLYDLDNGHWAYESQIDYVVKAS